MRWWLKKQSLITVEDENSFMELEQRLDEARKELEKVIAELEKLRAR